MRELSRGVLILSVDWPAPPKAGPRGADRLPGGQLAELLEFYQLPATWGVVELPPVGWGTATPLAEPALLADSSWAGPQVGRSAFHRELERRLGAARAANTDITSLIVCDTAPPDHCDLMQKLGLKAVRGVESAVGTDWPPPKSLRFGLYELPAALRFPSGNWLASLRLARRARHWINRAVCRRRPLHLVLDGPRLAEGGVLAMRLADSVLRLAVRRREEGRLSVETMALAAQRLQAPPGPGSATSILRPRAA
jgi:hypothetical protein